MSKHLILLAMILLSGSVGAQDPWPMERHDRWGSGRASIGPDPSTLTTPWNFLDLITSGGPVSYSPSLDANGFGYYGDWVGDTVYKFDTATGQVVNTFSALNFVNSMPAISNGQLFAITDAPGGQTFAIDEGTFDYNWFATTGRVAGSAIVGPDGSIVANYADGHITRYDPITGKAIWTRNGQGGTWGTLVLTRDDSLVVYPNGNHLSAVSWATGQTVWDVVLDGLVHGPCVADDGTIICGTEGDTVWALNPLDGSTKWSFLTLQKIFAPPALSPDGTTVYVGDLDTRLYSFRVADGHRNWSFTSSGAVTQGPIVGTDGSIYFTTYGPNQLYRVSPSGAQVWVVTLRGQPRGPLSIGPDGTLYAGYTTDTGSNSGLSIIRQQAIAEPIISYSLDHGYVVSGNLASLKAVDGNNLVMENTPTVALTIPGIRITLAAQLPYAPPASFNISLNTGVNTPGLTQTVELYNIATHHWDLIDTRPASLQDQSLTLPIMSASNYWNSSSKLILTRVAWRQTGFILSAGWQARMDYGAVTNVIPQWSP